MSANNPQDEVEAGNSLLQLNSEKEQEKRPNDGNNASEHHHTKRIRKKRKEKSSLKKICCWFWIILLICVIASLLLYYFYFKKKNSEYKDPVILKPPLGWIIGRKCLPRNLKIFFSQQQSLIKQEASDDFNLNYYIFRHDDEQNCWPNHNISFINQSMSLNDNYKLGIGLSSGCDFYDFSESKVKNIGRQLASHLNYVQLMQSGKGCKSKLKRGIVKSLYNGMEESKRETVFHSPYSFGLKEAKRSSDIFTIASDGLMNNLEEKEYLYALLDNFYFNFNGHFKPGFFPYPGSLYKDEFQFLNWCYMKSPLFFDQPTERDSNHDLADILKLFSKHKNLVKYHQNNETKPFSLTKKIRMKDRKSFRSRFFSVVSMPRDSNIKETKWISFKSESDNQRFGFYWAGEKNMCLTNTYPVLTIRQCSVRSALLQLFTYDNGRLYVNSKKSWVCIPNTPYMKAKVVNKEEDGCNSEIFIKKYKKTDNEISIVNKYGFKLRANLPDLYILSTKLSNTKFILAFNNLHSHKSHIQRLDYKNINEMKYGHDYEVICSDGNPRKTYENGRFSEEIKIKINSESSEYCFVTDKGYIEQQPSYSDPEYEDVIISE